MIERGLFGLCVVGTLLFCLLGWTTVLSKQEHRVCVKYVEAGEVRFEATEGGWKGVKLVFGADGYLTKGSLRKLRAIQQAHDTLAGLVPFTDEALSTPVARTVDGPGPSKAGGRGRPRCEPCKLGDTDCSWGFETVAPIGEVQQCVPPFINCVRTDVCTF